MHINTLKCLHSVFAERFVNKQFIPDFEFNQEKFQGVYELRWRNQYAHVFTTSFGVEREDKAGRATKILQAMERRIWRFYLCQAWIIMTSILPTIWVCYSQTFLLSLTARGFGGIPMLFLGLFADDIRRELNVSDDYKLLHGIAFGRDAMQNKTHLGRVPVAESAVLHW